MGFVWNILISFDNEEFWRDDEDEPRKKCEALEAINAWLPYGRLVSLIEPTYRKNASYGLDANLYGGGFKHFDIEGFIEVVEAQPWKARSKVQLWIKGGVEGMSEETFQFLRLVPQKKRSRPTETKRRTKKRP